MSDTTRNESVTTDDPPVRDGAAENGEHTPESSTETSVESSTASTTTTATASTTDTGTATESTTTSGDADATATRDEDGADESDADTAADTTTETTADTEAASDADTDPDADTEAGKPAAADDDDTGNDVIDEDDTDEDDDAPAGRPMGLVIALAAVAVLAVAALAVTALLYPGFLVKPGSPDDRAAEVTTALANKDAAALDAVSCRTQEGQPLNPLPPDALALIQSAVPAGPTQLMLDTQARVPVNLTLSAQGQTQTLPADLVLGVTDGNWCMTGLTQRQ